MRLGLALLSHPRHNLSMVNWEDRYRNGETPWDKEAPSPPLRAWLASRPVRGRVLVPGCGTGREVRLLAAQGAEPVGLDIAPSAVARARKEIPAGAETYLAGDFLQLPGSLTGIFDWVVEHTCFCALPPAAWPGYVRSTWRALKPGGHLLGVFYPRADNPPGEGPPYSIPPEELEAHFAPWFTLVHRHVPAVGFPTRLGREELHLWRKKAAPGPY